MNIPKLTGFDLKDKRVIVRMDLDVSKEGNYRIEVATPTIKYLLAQNAKVILIGHKGRPEGIDESLSLKPLMPIIEGFIGTKVSFEEEGLVTLKENLRFDKGEEENTPEFGQKLAALGDFYVNEAFAVSHREHASIVGLPKLLPHAAGLHFEKEIENLSKVLVEPRKPVIAIISGIKKDKLEMIKALLPKFDKILVGGKLPEYIDPDYGKEDYNQELFNNPKVMVGRLIQDRQDLTLNTVEAFEQEIKQAGTIVLASVMGKFEEEGHRQATKSIFQAVANSSAFKVVGGGDSLSAVSMFDLQDKFDWVSVGGGAMLEFLAKGTLLGIEALN